MLGTPEALESALKFNPDPRLRAQTIDQIATLGLSSRLVADWLHRSDLDPGQRQAVLMAWAETPSARVSPSVRTTVLQDARDAHAYDLDPGVHSAARLLLHRWQPGEEVSEPAPASMTDLRAPRSPTWVQGPNGHCLVVLPGPLTFEMGSPEDEPDRFPYENRHIRRIDRSIAVSTTEVTIKQMRGFMPEYYPDTRYVSDPAAPCANIVWYGAAKYCNWLSEQAGIDKSEWCYPDNLKQESVLFKDMYERTGFRLPSEAEWEYFTRAGTVTCRFFGESDELMPRYAWTWKNSGGHGALAEVLLPNPFGLFDTLGSLWEWCQDGAMGSDYYPSYPRGTEAAPAGDPSPVMPVNDNNWRIVRGGVFDGSPTVTRSAHRDVYRAHLNRYAVGFRVVRTVRAK